MFTESSTLPLAPCPKCNYSAGLLIKRYYTSFPVNIGNSTINEIKPQFGIKCGLCGYEYPNKYDLAYKLKEDWNSRRGI